MYGALYTCLVSRAIHIELLFDLTADCFMMSLRNLINLRGYVKFMQSDNGTNIVGADKELKKALYEFHDQLGERIALLEIEWHFNPPESPHFGGAWERLIGVTKTCLERVLKERFPREDTLRSALTEVTNVVNSRPYTDIPLDSTEAEPLTPNHLLLDVSSQNPALGRFESQDLCSKKQWRIAQTLADMFWKRWIAEYLPELAPRTKWLVRTKAIKIGDIAIYIDPKLHRND